MARKTPKKQQPPKEVAIYEPSDKEISAIASFDARRADASLWPTMKFSNGRPDIDHPSPPIGWKLLMESLGTASVPVTTTIIEQLGSSLSASPEREKDAINFGMAIIASIKPQDELETLLAAQMAAIHCATMTASRRLNQAGNIVQWDSAERTLNKLARTFTTQMETLKRYRTGGEQKVTVHHVTVNEGGQAIVGTVQQAKGPQGGEG